MNSLALAGMIYLAVGAALYAILATSGLSGGTGWRGFRPICPSKSL